MTDNFFASWEASFRKRVASESGIQFDPAHDLAHFTRVVATARALAIEENANLKIILPAAWLHDLVNVPKNDSRRSQASRLSADEAIRYLQEVKYPAEHYHAIRHAIEAHSYSAQIEAETLEAKIVQDADRLDGLGAIGIARCFSVGGSLQRKMYEPSDPFGAQRPLDDQQFTIDHFFVKLFKTVDTLQTQAGRAEGQRRVVFMKSYLHELAKECGVASL